MDLFDSESLTPPGSPVLGYSGLRDIHPQLKSTSDSFPVYCFRCKGPLRPQDKSFSTESLFLRGEVFSAVKQFNTTTINIPGNDPSQLHLLKFFGHKFDPTDIPQLKILVRMCRKNLYTLETLASPTFTFGLMSSNRNAQSDEDRPNPFKLRWDVCSFLNYIVGNRVKLTMTEKQDLFGGLRKALERPPSWTSSLQHHCGSKDGNECSSSEYHLFHLQLELRWSFLRLFEFSQPTLNWVMDDLLYLAFVKYKSIEGSLLEKVPFNCYCVKELWAMIRSTFEELKPNGVGFWELVSSSLSRFDAGTDFIFPLWLLSNLVLLGDYGMNGVYSVSTIPNQRLVCNQQDRLDGSENCYGLVNKVLKEWTQRGGKIYEVNELSYSLLRYWGFDFDVALTLWNSWLPKIDKGFEARNVDPYSTTRKWLHLISIVANSDHESEVQSCEVTGHNIFSNDPFLAFLRLFCAHVKLCSAKDWRKLKSNICNKLSPKTVAGFGENGLTRVSTMLLALALVSDDTESMTERLDETLNHGKDSLAILKLRARCVVILIHLQKGRDVSTVSKCIMMKVNEIMGMSVSGRTPVHKDLLMTYFDFLECVPKFNGEKNLGQSNLFSLNLTMWLSTCGPNYLNRTLRVLHNILDPWILNSLSLPTLEKEKITRIIHEKTEQFLKQTVISNQNRNPEFDVQTLADLAVDLTILLGSKKNSNAVAGIFEVFALNPNTTPVVSESYVERVVDSELVLDMNSIISETKLAQSWIRLVILGCAVPLKLTARVFNVPSEMTLGRDNDQANILKQFCDIINEDSSSCWTRDKLLTITSPVADALKAAKTKSYESNEPLVQNLLKSVVILFSGIHFNKIYVRSNPSNIVNQVLETCCPNVVGKPPWEKVPNSFLSPLNNLLPEIFKAVVAHEPWIQDPYLQRKMCDLIRFAILGFAETDEMVDSNPGLRIMQFCEKLDSQRRTMIMQEISNGIYTLSKDEQISRRILLTVKGFLKRRMIVTSAYFIGPVLDVLAERVEFCSPCRSIIWQIFAYVIGKESFGVLRPVLLHSLETILKKHFAFRSDRFFELFNGLAISNSQLREPIREYLATEVIPILRFQVELSEQRQASGTNFKLRSSLSKLEKELGL